MDRRTDRQLSSKASGADKAQHDASPQPREAKRRRLSSPANMTETRDADDSEVSLRKIRERRGISIMDMMQQIQATHFERDKASAFVRDLKCLRLKHLGDTIKFKTAQINVFDEDCAIASWPWQCSKYEDPSVGCCLIEDDNGKSRLSQVRNSVWTRAAAFMRHKGVEYLWIDRECIAQDNDEQKEKAMGEMDLLYHNGTHPFGVLTRPLEKKSELRLLAQILQGTLAYQSRHTGEFQLKKGVTIASARKAIRLLDKITSDIWWTRAWIYQENYHGGEEMLLLMPHDSAWERSKGEYGDLFGSLKGELIINSIKFCQAATEVCSTVSAWSTSDELQQLEEVAHRILSKSARYSVRLEGRSSMSPTVIADIVKRGVTNHSDRLAIIANCCSYNRRFNSNTLKKKELSVSLAMLVLFLLNGEIFYHEPDESPWDMTSSSDLTVVDFIQKHAFDRFSPPFAEKWLSFNKSCRFAHVSLKADGVHTRGHLWKLLRRTIEISPREIEDCGQVEETLRYLHGYIKALPNQKRLACKLGEFLTTFTQYPRSPERKYMWKMARKLAVALRDGSTLRLGYLANSSEPGWHAPMGIFICPDETMQESDWEVTVLTSFEPRKTSNGFKCPSDVDKHVSLQVDFDQDGGLPPKLIVREWIHGLWFCEEEPKSVVFPLPRILSEL